MQSPRLARAGVLLGATVTAITVAACGGTQTQTHGLTVVASTDVWGSIARAVAADHAKVDSILTSPTDDPHSYEATPANAAAIADASLVVYNGGGYDHWVDDVLAAHPAVATVDAYSLLGAETTPDGPANEHVFYDPTVAKAVAARVAVRLASDDAAHADAYRANAAEFGRQTDAIAASERTIGEKHPGAAVVSTEPVAHYLLVNAGITDRTPEGFASAAEQGDDPSPADLAAPRWTPWRGAPQRPRRLRPAPGTLPALGGWRGRPARSPARSYPCPRRSPRRPARRPACCRTSRA